MIMQLLINILIAAALYWQIAASYALAYYPSRLFQLTHAIVLTSAAYFAYSFFSVLHFPLWVAILLAIACSTVVGVLPEILLYSYCRKRELSTSTAMIASLGLYTVLQSILILIWGNETKTLYSGSMINEAHTFLGAYITDAQIIILATATFMVLGFVLLMNRTAIGRRTRALSSNPELSIVCGINGERVIRTSYLIGSAMAALTGILIAFEINITPSMGFHWLLYGITAMIIGGVGSISGLAWGALLIATLQHTVAYFLGSQWMELVTFVVLIVFLLIKPLGFSGKRLKKIEI